jgi:hypothetical protein
VKPETWNVSKGGQKLRMVLSGSFGSGSAPPADAMNETLEMQRFTLHSAPILRRLAALLRI